VFGGRGTKGVKFLKTGEKKDFEVLIENVLQNAPARVLTSGLCF
jgi:hypothetical protein